MRAADAIQTLQPCKNRLHFALQQDCFIEFVALHNADTAISPFLGYDGNPCTAQGIHISQNRAVGYLELLRQFKRCDLLPLQQHGENSNQSV